MNSHQLLSNMTHLENAVMRQLAENGVSGWIGLVSLKLVHVVHSLDILSVWNLHQTHRTIPTNAFQVSISSFSKSDPA